MKRKVNEVFIREQGNDVVQPSRPANWDAYLAGSTVAPVDFMDGVEDLPAEERDFKGLKGDKRFT